MKSTIQAVLKMANAYYSRSLSLWKRGGEADSPASIFLNFEDPLDRKFSKKFEHDKRNEQILAIEEKSRGQRVRVEAEARKYLELEWSSDETYKRIAKIIGQDVEAIKANLQNDILNIIKKFKINYNFLPPFQQEKQPYGGLAAQDYIDIELYHYYTHNFIGHDGERYVSLDEIQLSSIIIHELRHEIYALLEVRFPSYKKELEKIYLDYIPVSTDSSQSMSQYMESDSYVRNPNEQFARIEQIRYEMGSGGNPKEISVNAVLQYLGFDRDLSNNIEMEDNKTYLVLGVRNYEKLGKSTSYIYRDANSSSVESLLSDIEAGKPADKLKVDYPSLAPVIERISLEKTQQLSPKCYYMGINGLTSLAGDPDMGQIFLGNKLHEDLECLLDKTFTLDTSSLRHKLFFQNFWNFDGPIGYYLRMKGVSSVELVADLNLDLARLMRALNETAVLQRGKQKQYSV